MIKILEETYSIEYKDIYPLENIYIKLKQSAIKKHGIILKNESIFIITKTYNIEDEKYYYYIKLKYHGKELKIIQNSFARQLFYHCQEYEGCDYTIKKEELMDKLVNFNDMKKVLNEKDIKYMYYFCYNFCNYSGTKNGRKSYKIKHILDTLQKRYKQVKAVKDSKRWNHYDEYKLELANKLKELL